MEKYRSWLLPATLILLVPALLIHLGLPTFIDDESIRALVALEMKLSGNYITPTLNGDYYFNKPPLFNWYLLVFFELFGRFDEFTARLATIVSLLGYSATLYYFFSRHYGARAGWLNALVFITCGRVLFWDSMLALIDITFSWVIFTSFMVIYHEFEKGRWWRLFGWSYALIAAGFLLKGLPAIVFQGITLLAYFSYRGQFRRLFSLPHVAGGGLFLLIVGAYYFSYHQYHSLETVFTTLFSESSKRTVVNYGWWNTVVHLFTFPFEMVYHFLPWSLMVLYLFRRDIRQVILGNSFLTFILITFLANLVVYWTSPEVYPRYLLMLAPLIFAVFLYLHEIHRQEGSLQFRLLDRLFFFLLLLIALGSYSAIFLEDINWIPGRLPKAIVCSVALSFLVWLYQRLPKERLLVIILFLVVFRIEFNWFVIPHRNANDFGNISRISSQEAGASFPERKMYLYQEAEMQITNSFYMTNARGEIIPRKMDNFDFQAVYVINPALHPDLNYEKVGEFRLRHGRLTYHLGILKNK